MRERDDEERRLDELRPPVPLDRHELREARALIDMRPVLDLIVKDYEYRQRATEDAERAEKARKERRDDRNKWIPWLTSAALLLVAILTLYLNYTRPH